MRSHGGVSGGKGGNKSSGRKGRTMEDDEDIEVEENKMRSHGGMSRSNGNKSNSGRKGRTMEEDLETEESKMTMCSDGVRLGGSKKTSLKQIVGRGKW